VQRGEPPAPNGRDARAVLAIILGLYQASATHTVQLIDHLEVQHAGH
jgi:hypothetical protein